MKVEWKKVTWYSQVIAIVLFVAVFALGFYLGNISPKYQIPSLRGGGVACTMEAKICPDGSAVGRTGPNCEFSPCPVNTP